MKDRVVKIKREMQELFLKPIIVSKDDMDRFGKNEMKQLKTLGMIG